MRMVELERNGASTAVLQEPRWKSCLPTHLVSCDEATGLGTQLSNIEVAVRNYVCPNSANILFV